MIRMPYIVLSNHVRYACCCRSWQYKCQHAFGYHSNTTISEVINRFVFCHLVLQCTNNNNSLLQCENICWCLLLLIKSVQVNSLCISSTLLQLLIFLVQFTFQYPWNLECFYCRSNFWPLQQMSKIPVNIVAYIYKCCPKCDNILIIVSLYCEWYIMMIMVADYNSTNAACSRSSWTDTGFGREQLLLVFSWGLYPL